MHLKEILKYRAVPLEGVYLCLTRKCALSCEHCSTYSHPLANESPRSKELVQFVESFNESIAPKILFLTGGEPLMLPKLVSKLTDIAHFAGSRVVCITGLFFASIENGSKLLNEIKNIDHLMISIDIFHEKQIGRNAIFKMLHKIRKLGIDISISTVGFGKDDLYLKDLIKYVRTEFEDQVPLFVNSINPVGRAKSFYSDIQSGPIALSSNESEIEGCKMMAWPVVAFDGTIVTCCNESVIDEDRPDHLILGHIRDTNWEAVRKKVTEDVILKAIRSVGPKYISRRFAPERACNGYCNTCKSLDTIQGIRQNITPWIQTPGMKILDDYISSYYYDKIIFNISPFSELISIGLDVNTIHKNDNLKEE